MWCRGRRRLACGPRSAELIVGNLVGPAGRPTRWSPTGGAWDRITVGMLAGGRCRPRPGPHRGPGHRAGMSDDVVDEHTAQPALAPSSNIPPSPSAPTAWLLPGRVGGAGAATAAPTSTRGATSQRPTATPPARALPKVTTLSADRLRPPDLVTQDKLHVISRVLGTRVDPSRRRSTSWPGRGVPGCGPAPRSLAWTATVRRVAAQTLPRTTGTWPCFPSGPRRREQLLRHPAAGVRCPAGRPLPGRARPSR